MYIAMSVIFKQFTGDRVRRFPLVIAIRQEQLLSPQLSFSSVAANVKILLRFYFYTF